MSIPNYINSKNTTPNRIKIVEVVVAAVVVMDKEVSRKIPTDKEIKLEAMEADQISRMVVATRNMRAMDIIMEQARADMKQEKITHIYDLTTVIVVQATTVVAAAALDFSKQL